MANFPTSNPSFPTRTPLQSITAALVNSIQDEIVAIGTWLLGQAPASYAPTWSGTIGDGTITGKYFQVGKLVRVEVVLTWGTTTSCGAGTTQTFTLPVTAAAAGRQCGAAILVDATTAVFTALGTLATTGTVSFYNCDGSQSGNLVGNTPFVWTTNDSFSFSGEYFAA